MSYLRLAAAQLNTVVGDLPGNVERILAALAAAEAAGADICVVPELAIPGYPPEDLLLKPTFVADNVVALEKVAAATGQCAIVVGYVGRDPGRAGAVQRGGALCRRPGGRDLPEAVPARTTGCSTSSAGSCRAMRRRPSSGWPAPGWGSRCARTCGSPMGRWRSRATPGPTWWST